jgi:hypothetical protein
MGARSESTLAKPQPSSRTNAYAVFTLVVLVSAVGVVLVVGRQRAVEAREARQAVLAGRIGDDWASLSAEHGDLVHQRAPGERCPRVLGGMCASVTDDVVWRVEWDISFRGLIEDGTSKDDALRAMVAFLPRDAVEKEATTGRYRGDPEAGWHKYLYVSAALAEEYPDLDWGEVEPGTLAVVLSEPGGLGGPVGGAVLVFPPSGLH